MKKSTMIWISIISTIFTLCYTIGAYYGYNRNIYLRYTDGNSLIKSYAALDKANKNRIVVSMYVDCKFTKLEEIKPVILSLMDQTVRVDEIALAVSNLENTPEFITQTCLVYEISDKYGNNGNLIPCLIRERDANTKIILLSSKIVYGADFIEMMVEESNTYPNTIIISDKTVLLEPDFIDPKIMNGDYECNDCDCIKDNAVVSISYPKIPYVENYKL